MKENGLTMGCRRVLLTAMCILLAAGFTAAACACLPLRAEAAEQEKVTRDFYAMDTVLTLTAYGDGAAEGITKAGEEIERLDALLSTARKESEVASINAASMETEGEMFALSEDSIALLTASLYLNEETGGAFDITIYPLMQLWGFPTKEYRVPSDDEIAGTLALVGSDRISFDPEEGEMSFPMKGMEIDFGGIAKGYAAERILQIFRDAGITSGLVSLGGNVQTLGTKPDGSPWKIAIQNPYGEENYLGVLQAADKAVVTSGGYERYFEENGKRYHHILDPATGCPADSGLLSVTIINDDGMMADGLSTALFVMGEEKAVEFWRNHADEFQMVLYTSDDRLLASPGLRDCFTSDNTIEWIA